VCAGARTGSDHGAKTGGIAALLNAGVDNRSTSFNYLPMAKAEAIGNHIFLCQVRFRSEGPDLVA